MFEVQSPENNSKLVNSICPQNYTLLGTHTCSCTDDEEKDTFFIFDVLKKGKISENLKAV